MVIFAIVISLAVIIAFWLALKTPKDRPISFEKKEAGEIKQATSKRPGKRWRVDSIDGNIKRCGWKPGEFSKYKRKTVNR